MTKVITFTEAQVTALAQACRDKTSADKMAEKAQEKRAGSYTVATTLAVEYADNFDGAMGALFKDIRSTGKLARSFGAKANDKGDGWTIPSSLMSAKSVLTGAMKVGVNLLDDEGAPRPFGQIRSDKRDVEKALKDAERKPEQIQRDALAAQLREFADSLVDLEVDPAGGEWCEGAGDVLTEMAADLARLMGETEAEQVEAGDDEAAAHAAAVEAEAEELAQVA